MDISINKLEDTNGCLVSYAIFTYIIIKKQKKIQLTTSGKKKKVQNTTVYQ